MAADVEIVHEPQPAPSRAQPGDAKLSRYRTVRKAQLKQQETEVPRPPPIPDDVKVQENIQRSMSRYRRSQPSSSRNKTEPAPPLPQPATATKADTPHALGRRYESYNIQAKAQRPQPEFGGALRRRAQAESAAKQDESRNQGTLLDQQARRKAHPVGVSEGEQLLAKERERYERIKAQQRAERAEQDKILAAERRKREAEEAEIRRVEEEKRAEEERIRRLKEEEQERAAREKEEAKQRQRDEKAARKRRPTNVTVPSQDQTSSPQPSSRGSGSSPTSSRRVGGFFRRKKEDGTPRPSTAADDRRPKTSHASPPKFDLPTIKPGGGGIVPLSDAPVSGVASAERRVRIRFGKSEINLPVEPTTSAQQLIKSASNVMSEQFNPREAVIYEHYRPENIRRPLRMYEHVQKVLNSWEDDHQNYLMIEPSDPEADQELYEAHAPQQHQLRQFERWLMYQYKPGKFDDRWITVRTDGQILAAKNQSGKDVVQVCNISDFDIYAPILDPKRQKKKSRTVTLLVKSQQKSAMFLNKSDFIHVFCTEDKQAAEDFFRAVQDWRSYYLVNKMGQGKGSKLGDLASDPTGGHQRSKSVESHYMLGSFNDLGLDFSNFGRTQEPSNAEKRKDSFDENRPLGAFGLALPSAQEHSRMMHQRQLSERKERTRVPPTALRHGIPNRPGGREDALAALNGASQNHRLSWDSTRSGDDAFNPNGLLGSQYQQRKHNAKASQDYGGGLQRNTSVRSSISQRRNSFDSGTLGRHKSVRQPDFGKPLVDLTPQYKEPPQFAKRGKGFKPDQIGSGGLIENATSPENPLGIPGNNDWRARPSTSGGGLEKSKSINRTKSTRRQPHGAPDDLEPFTVGLLAQSGKSGWGDGQVGHGVISGNHAKGPMLDMSEPSLFGSGTLLRKMEAQNLGNPVGK
ncbi:uncharacterized protein PV09_02130 [Verruconis gallopava]|uniref:PH domain-containing protein n=1 Tax=Verruconis gallopava TaxID=253628 RepID=A0A0D1XWU5_9PEZI|nr:uncharacterized protein PV09_02130 [Verruconis gallopava]KIW07276.1 hypothetical protein PV09_02130 [Verruconis gallopava]